MRSFNYTEIAEYYDLLEDSDDIKDLNTFLHHYFETNNLKSVLDMACGTGLQSIYLHQLGYDVVATDINSKMLEIAAKKYDKIQFKMADMIDVGFDRSFDAVISSFNAIGHLTRNDFRRTISNAWDNLKAGGVYIFDIFNYDFIARNFIDHEFIDVCKEVEEIRIVRFNKNTLNKTQKMMHINQKTYVQENLDEIQIFEHSWDMQIYSVEDLEGIFEGTGFEISFVDINGSSFDVRQSLFILAIARKPLQ